MRNKTFVLFVGVFLLVSASVFAQELDVPLKFLPCFVDEDCEGCSTYTGKAGGVCYCNTDDSLCHWTDATESDDIVDFGDLTGDLSDIGDLENQYFFDSLNENLTSNETIFEEEVVYVEEELAVIYTEISKLENKSASTEVKVNAIEQDILTLQQHINSIKMEIDNVRSLQTQMESDVNQNIQSVSTGLAVLQEDLTVAQTNLTSVEQDVQKERDFTKFLITLFFVLVALAGAIFGIYYFTGKKVNPQIKKYITSHIKSGKKYSHIKQNLLKAGWKEDEIKLAYKATRKHNYKQYRNNGADKNKIIFISIFSILLIVGVILLLRGVTTGKAIYFPTQEELSMEVKSQLEKSLERNIFYSKIDKIHLCVQVVDGPNTVSYNVVKTKRGHFVTESRTRCDDKTRAGFAVKFLDWGSFLRVTNNLNCKNIEKVHKKGMYVLPSEYVLKGFKLNEELDYSSYCEALKECLSDEEISSIGIRC